MFASKDELELHLAREKLAMIGATESQLPEYLLDDDTEALPIRTPEELLLAHYREDTLSAIKTVRFLKDFERYNAKPDLTTKNVSFLKVAEIFRLMGIKNYYFCLQLNNPLLMGVDPYDPNLTDEQKFMVLQECRENFWYFLREVLHLSGGIQFQANRANICFLWCYLCHVNTMLIIPRQFGKLSKLDSLVKVPNGWRRMGDIKINDVVNTPDGGTARVSGVYPQGVKSLYRVTFYDGRTADVGAEHYWTVWDPGKGDGGIWRTLTTLECQQRMTEMKKAHNYLSVPLVQPDNDPDKKLAIHPYVLGVLLGDGGISGSSVLITKPDEELYDKVRGLIPDTLVAEWCNEKTFVIKRKPDIEEKTNVMKENLKSVDLMGLRSWEKFVPTDYLNGSYRQRLELLQGLLDTDGHAGTGGNIEYCTTSPKLAKDFVYLARSIGAICTCKERQTYYTDKGERKPGRVSYRISVRYTKPWELFTLSRKRDRLVDKTRGLKFNSRLTMRSIEYVGEEETQCIEVDHPDHLYIMDDFVVTHNTVSAQSIMFWLTYLTGQSYESHLITLKDDNRSQFVEALKGIRNNIPSYLTNVGWRDKDSGNSLTYSAFGDDKKNIFRISVPQIGREAARNVGRGLTIKTRMIDEPAYINFMEEILNGAGPSTLTARANARRIGEPYGTGFITTPASKTTASGEYMYNMLMDATEWRETFFDSFNESHLYQRLIKASPVEGITSPTVGMVFNYLQLGRNKDWVKKTIDELKLSLAEAKIDLLLMWDDASKGKLFDDLTREALNEGKRGILWSQEVGSTGLFIDWFITPEEHTRIITGDSQTFYVVGCDTSAAQNRDACTVVIRDVMDGKVIGVGRYPIAYLMDVGEVLQTILLEIKNSLLIIERNFAHHMIDQLLVSLPALGIDPFKRIFNQIVQDPVKYEKEMIEFKQRNFANRDSHFYLKFKHLFGFVTNARTRDEVYSFIQEAVGTTGDKIYYTKLIDELVNLKEKGGRIDHENNKHDDLVIAWLLGFWFLKLGNNKSEYGIPPGISMSKITLMRVGDSRNEETNGAHNEAMVALYRRKVEELSDRLIKTSDNTVAQRIEYMIDKLSSMIPQDKRKSLTIDEIVRKAKEERSRRVLEARKLRSRYAYM